MKSTCKLAAPRAFSAVKRVKLRTADRAGKGNDVNRTEEHLCALNDRGSRAGCSHTKRFEQRQPRRRILKPANAIESICFTADRTFKQRFQSRSSARATGA